VSAPAIVLSGLVVSEGRRRLLGPVDLEVERGEHVLVVGPSGCGKTTLLRAVAGLARPKEGTVELFGRRASDGRRLLLRPEERRVGMLFQGGALWPHLSARRTLAFVLRSAGGEATPERVAELLARVQLGGFEERLPGTMSGGERQRLALARALACEPELLLLDEPLGPLDAELRADLLGMLAALHASEGWTTLHVTHDPAEASGYAGRTVRLVDGRIAPEPQTPTGGGIA
jgi:iron(III) transport system ATP-binding protein